MKIKRIICIIFALAILGSAAIMAASHPFEDVAANGWYSEDIKYVYDNALMNGISEELFAPNENMTRAMLVTVLYRLEGEPDVKGKLPFYDVKGNVYYSEAVLWAYDNNIVKGISSDCFAPDREISREQTVTILARYAKNKGLDIESSTTLADYGDAQRISDYAQYAFRWAVEAGIINGITNDTLAPQGSASRAQCAAILHRFVEWKLENAV